MQKENIQIIQLSTATRFLDSKSIQAKNLKDTANKVKVYILITFCKTKFNSYYDETIHFINVPRITSLMYIFKIKKEIKKILNKNTKTIITAGSPFDLGLLGVLLKYTLKIPLNIQIHTDIFSEYFLKDLKRNKLYYQISKITIPFANTIRTVSVEVKEKIEKKYPKKIVLNIPEVISLKEHEFYQKSKNKDLIKFIYPARYVKMKNHENLFQAFIKLNKKYPNTILETFGDGPEKKYLFEKYHNNYLKIKDWSNDLQKEYFETDFLVSTSLYEGFGMIIIEALKYGKPCLITPFGGGSYLIKENINGYISKDFSKKEIYNLLEKGYLNKEKFNEEKIKESVKDFTKENMDKELIRLWKETIKK